MLEYKSPTTLDMPEIVTELVEHPDPRGPFGAKEVGQGPLLPIMPALANAVYDAVGVRIDEIPITPEKILKPRSRRRPPAKRHASARRVSRTSTGPTRCRSRRPGRGRRMWRQRLASSAPLRPRPESVDMMRLPASAIARRATIDEAAGILAEHGDAMVVAGGTDVLAEHEAAPANADGARGLAWHRGTAGMLPTATV